MALDGITKDLRLLHAQRTPAEPAAVQPAVSQPTPSFKGNFKAALDQAVHSRQPLHISKHAHMRLSSRQIQLTSDQLTRVDEGLNRAGAKGIRDSLVLVDDVALVVNVQSKTVITALGREPENVFSNIDDAVIV